MVALNRAVAHHPVVRTTVLRNCCCKVVMSTTVQHSFLHTGSFSSVSLHLGVPGCLTQRVACDLFRPAPPPSTGTYQLYASGRHLLGTLRRWQRAHDNRICTVRRKCTGYIRNSRAVARCTSRGTAEEDTAITSNGSSHAVDIVPAEAVKSNGSTISPHQGNGDQNGSGGGGGSGDDRGGGGDDSPDNDRDPQPKVLLLLLTIVAGSTSLYGIYQLVLAVGRLIEQRHSIKPEAKAELRFDCPDPAAQHLQHPTKHLLTGLNAVGRMMTLQH